MALESATYISQLVDTNPAGSDSISQGDDHLRLIKDVLQNSLPDVNQAVATIIPKAIAPTTQVLGTIWYDTGNALLKINTAATGATPVWVTVNEGAPWAAVSPASTSCFRVHRNGTDQGTSGGGAVDQIEWTNADWDEGSEFTLYTSDPATQSRFTAKTAGKYFFNGTVSEVSGSGADDDLYMYKNGTIVASYMDFGQYDGSYGSVMRTMNINTIMDLSVDDYVELKFRTEHTAVDLTGAATSTYFEGYKLY